MKLQDMYPESKVRTQEVSEGLRPVYRVSQSEASRYNRANVVSSQECQIRKDSSEVFVDPSEASRSSISRAVKSELCYPANTCAVKAELLCPANTYVVKSELSPLAISPSPPLTADLENFQDLTEWCRKAPKSLTMSASTDPDELNTPIIELEDFLFTSPTSLDNANEDCYSLLNVTGSISCADIQTNKFSVIDQPFGYKSIDNKSETNQYSNVYINDNGGGEVTEKTKKVHYDNMDSCNINNIFTQQVVYNDLNQPSASFNTEFYVNCTDLTKDNTVLTNSVLTNTELTNSVLTLTPEQIIAVKPEDTSSCEVVSETSVVEIEPSNLFVHSDEKQRKVLKLDFSNLWNENKSAAIDTPEIINTALELDSGFNLVNFINNESELAEEFSENVPSPKYDEQSQCASTSNDFSNFSTPTESSEDEEYVPPWKKNKKSPGKSKKSKSMTRISKISPTGFTISLSKTDYDNTSSKRDFDKREFDSELSNISSIESVKVVRRGRPPKRKISVSSESGDVEVSRYRELRDKNNEASRRSRMNRKMKEYQLEQEGIDLEEKNRKLKVRVEELEKLVNNMRSNLMQMLLKK